MTNHVHLLVTPETHDACALLMKNVSQCYVQRTNHRLSRTGTLWEGRFRSCLVHTESYILACYRYIEFNPVRQGMVDSPEAYPWSSYSTNAFGAPSDIVVAHPAYQALGTDQSQARRAYAELCQDCVPQEMLDEIRKATRVGCITGTVRRGKGRPSSAR